MGPSHLILHFFYPQATPAPSPLPFRGRPDIFFCDEVKSPRPYSLTASGEWSLVSSSSCRRRRRLYFLGNLQVRTSLSSPLGFASCDTPIVDCTEAMQRDKCPQSWALCLYHHPRERKSPPLTKVMGIPQTLRKLGYKLGCTHQPLPESTLARYPPFFHHSPATLMPLGLDTHP